MIDSNNYKLTEITSRVIKSYYNVYNKLGNGFLEKVYENSMVIEMTSMDLVCQAQYPVDVYYNGQKVGVYFADILVNGCLILEIKAADSLCEAHEAQLTNYLKGTNIEVGLLLNFGKKPEIKRKVFDNHLKKIIKDHNQS